jgi:hypothetical protein
MRVVGHLPDTRMKITVFENDGRFPVQFEQGGLTQIYRFRKGELLRHFGQLQSLIDEDFRQSVLQQFAGMRLLHQGVLESLSPAHDPTEDFPTIL